MASRIVASFAQRDIDALGPGRWAALQGQLTSSLNLLTGATVYWQRSPDGFVVLVPNPIGQDIGHASDCAVHNEPALPPAPCDCGAECSPMEPVRVRYLQGLRRLREVA